MIGGVESRGPAGRRGQRHRGRLAALPGQIHGRDVRRTLLHQLQGPPVERLDHDAASEMLRLDQAEQQRHEALRVRRLGGKRRIELGLDVETDMLVARAPHEIDHLFQRRNARRRDAGAVQRALLGELLGVLTAGSDLADIVGLHLGERQRVQQRPGRRNIVAGRIAGEIGVEPPLMRDDEHAVAGHTDVELERIDMKVQRPAERLQRVLRMQAATAAMRLDIERGCGAGETQEQQAENKRGLRHRGRLSYPVRPRGPFRLSRQFF